jgi:hypothetical protein
MHEYVPPEASAADRQPIHLVDPIAEAKYDTLISEWQKDAQEKHASVSQTPEVIDDGLGLHFPEISLYHGGAVKDIESFRRSNDTTVGAGLYATSMPDQAFGYAVVRAFNFEDGYSHRIKIDDEVIEPKIKPVVYELDLKDVNFVDLRKQQNIDRLLPGPFADYLNTWIESHQEELKNDSYHLASGAMSDALGYLRKIGQVKEGFLKPAIGSYYLVGEVFSEYMSSLGYDGAITEEGGEHMGSERRYAGKHDSWIIFDPQKIQVTKELSFDSPEMINQNAVEYNRTIQELNPAFEETSTSQWW